MPWLVLVGSHAAGKSTIGRALADEIGCVFDAEIGDELIPRDRPSTKGRDAEIGRLESERDRLRLRTLRVVETWHTGNAAWARFRGSPEIANDMIEQAKQIIASEMVLCFSLKCADEERSKRRKFLEGKTVQIGSETETLEMTRRIANDAESGIRRLLPTNCFHVVPTDGGRVVAEIIEEICSLTLNSVMTRMRHSIGNLEEAGNVFRTAPLLLGRLAKQMPQKIVSDTTFRQYPSIVIVVEGLDGSGKSTVVKKLHKHLGSRALHMKSPPESLDAERACLENACDSIKRKHCESKGFHAALRTLQQAFYMLGNYAMYEKVLKFDNPGPLVVDRFASSTLAYKFGFEYANSGISWIPLWLSALFLRNPTWPPDLPRPEIVIMLEAREDVRLKRIQRRSAGVGFGVGEWEQEYEKNPCLGPAIVHFMKSIQRGPPIIPINANSNNQDDVFRNCANGLIDQGIALVYRSVVSQSVCETLADQYSKAQRNELEKSSLNRYKWDLINEVYSSRRHRNVSICFLQSEETQSVVSSIQESISKATGRQAWSVEDDILPVFHYEDGGSISPHRDVDLTNLQDYCAILLISRAGVDFQNGSLFINSQCEVDGSGQPVSEVESKRQYFRDLQQGDIVVFRNSRCVHGVESVYISETENRNGKKPRGRITVSFRI